MTNSIFLFSFNDEYEAKYIAREYYTVDDSSSYRQAVTKIGNIMINNILPHGWEYFIIAGDALDYSENKKVIYEGKLSEMGDNI